MNRHQQIKALYEATADLAEHSERVHFLSEAIAEHYFADERKRKAEKELTGLIEGYRGALRDALKAAERIKT